MLQEAWKRIFKKEQKGTSQEFELFKLIDFTLLQLIKLTFPPTVENGWKLPGGGGNP